MHSHIKPKHVNPRNNPSKGALGARDVVRVQEPSFDYTATEAGALIKAQGLRIRNLRTQAKLTIQDLSQKTELHSNTIGRIERGDSEANTEQLLLIARALGVAPAKLMHFSGTSEAGDGGSGAALGDQDFALVDMIDIHVSAGGGAFNGHSEVIGRFAFKQSWLARKGISPDKAKIVRARGDSMADRINNGDILLVNTEITSLGPDGIYVIELDGLDYVKLIQRDFSTGGVQVISYNKDYKPQSLSAEQAAALRISGKVVWHAGEF
ncbi:Phage repressor protein C, contains Cro/C1-type HTH and peptisase s24 domains [Rhodoferax sp. OV413]|nr:Phage repressor protein C, contains Cro/C1-type HTH and peptisase s24 domains [Rhodoferax sp. OV413]